MGCPGVNGTSYTLSVTPILPDHDVKPYKCTFAFYNGVEEQERNTRLSHEKSELQKKIEVFEGKYMKLLADQKEIQDLVEITLVEGRRLLNSAGREFSELKTSTEINKKSRELHDAVKEISQLPRLTCMIPVFSKKDSEILGKVARLAQVEDESEAKVLSWHLSSALDCVVTTTMQKAEEIKNETNGEQGLLALDEPFGLRDWQRPLPHEHNEFLGRQDRVPPNVVYAKHQLKFSVHVEECKQVFHQLLGDSIIVDTVQDALAYREMVLRNMKKCPTIFTRDGNRLSEGGTFCGSLNRCPDDLNGRVFSQTERSELKNIKRQIDVLRKAEEVFLKLFNLQTKRHEKNVELRSKDVRKQQQEIDVAKSRVQVIESLLPRVETIEGSRKRKQQESPQPWTTKSEGKRAKYP